MSKKNEFEELVRSVDQKFKRIEENQKRAQELHQKKSLPKTDGEPSRREVKMKEHQQQQKFRAKEKLTAAAVVFILGHLLLIPVYSKHILYAPQIFIVSSLSLGVICLAVIDYG